MLKLKEIKLMRALKKMRATGDKVAIKYQRAYFFLDSLLTLNCKNTLKEFFLKKLWDFKLSNKTAYFILFIICLIGAFLRLQDIHHFFNIDEITTTWVIKDSFRDIFTRCWVNNLSPLYYILVYCFESWLGLSEAVLRIPSVIPGVLSIPLFFLITFKLSGSKTLSLFAAFLSAVDRYLLSYSQEVRPYALVIFFSLLCFYLFLYYLKKENKSLYAMGLGLLSGILILLHYTAAVICIVLVFMAGIYFFQTKNLTRKRIIELLIFSITLCIFLLPFFNHLYYLFSFRKILTNYFLDSYKTISFIAIMLPPLMMYVTWPLISSVFFEPWKKEDFLKGQNNISFNWYFLLLWYFIPLVFFTVLALLNIVHMLFPRYMVLMIPVPIIAGMVITASYKSKWAKLIYMVVLLFMTQIYYQDAVLRNFKWNSNDKHWEWGFYNTKSKFGWKDAVNRINNSGIAPSKVYVVTILTEKQMVNTGSPYDSLLNDYLLSAVNSIYKLDDNYLKKAELLNSAWEISYDESDYLLVGRRTQIMFQDKTGFKKLSPENATIDIYYKE